jgi:hypothetical protein
MSEIYFLPLIKQLAIRLNPQAVKSLVIRRMTESSVFKWLGTGLYRCDELLKVQIC